MPAACASSHARPAAAVQHDRPTLRPPRCRRRPIDPAWTRSTARATRRRRSSGAPRPRVERRVQRGAPDHRIMISTASGRRGPRRERAAESTAPTPAERAPASAAHRVAHARGEVIPEERRRLGHVVARRSAPASRAARPPARGTPRTPRRAGVDGRQPAGVFDQVDEFGFGEVFMGQVCSSFFRFVQRVKEVGFHGADRAPEDAGDLLVRQLVVHAEDERRPLLLRQPRDGRADLRRALAAQQRSRRRAPRASRRSVVPPSSGSSAGVFHARPCSGRRSRRSGRATSPSDAFPLKPSRPRYARMNTSCARSLASSWLPTNR